MKQIDITDSVMKHVVSYERTGISRWLKYFFVCIVTIGVSEIIILVLIIRDLLEKRTFDLFELLSQDSEIIKEFGSEVLYAFWDELPQDLFKIGFAVLIMLVCIVAVTKRKRLKIKKKMRQLEKYS